MTPDARVRAILALLASLDAWGLFVDSLKHLDAALQGDALDAQAHALGDALPAVQDALDHLARSLGAVTSVTAPQDDPAPKE